MRKSHSTPQKIYTLIIYIICIALAILSILPFWIMIVNATRSTEEIFQKALSLLPSNNIGTNIQALIDKKDFNPIRGFMNSMIISSCATILTVYFSSLTAYALVAYDWKFRQAFFTFILIIMMIPAQLSIVGFYQFMSSLGLKNSFIPFIVPAVVAPTSVFFMRQYLLGSLSIDIVNSARIDSAGEVRIFNSIILPIMKPAVATQAIFSFVGNWNNLFLPLILLNDSKKKTLPIMVSLLRGDIYKTEFGAIYLGLALTVMPLFIVYFLLSKYIIAGVALGGIKE